MLIPKKVKHRKWHKRAGMSGSNAARMNRVSFGNFGMKSMTESWVSSRQIEAARRVMVRFTRKGGKIWIRIFPDKPITKKGDEVGMGKGKGAPDHFVAVVKPGTVMFEMSGISEDKAKEAIEMASYKLPVKIRFIVK